MTTRAGGTHLKESLLEAYCLGTASPEETAQIEAWFSTNPGRRVWYEQLKAALREGDFSPISSEERSATWLGVVRAAFYARPEGDDTLLSVAQLGDTAKAAYQILPEYSGQKLGTGPQTFRTAREKEEVFSGRTLRWGVFKKRSIASRPLISRSSRQNVRYVAAFMLIAVAAWLVRGEYKRSAAVPTLTYTTGYGQRATITLPDSETVVLDVASRLDVPTDYAAGNRTVRVTGKALFTVTHHSGSPFTVVAGSTVTRVLGTTFVVQYYPGDTTTVVAVRTGKVAIRSIVVPASRQLVIDRRGVEQIQPLDLSQFSFTAGVLTLDDRRFVDAIPELNRWYGVDIRLGDTVMMHRRVTGSFGAGSLADLITLLKLMDVRVVRDGRTITLYSR